jgi:hypothetical protein
LHAGPVPARHPPWPAVNLAGFIGAGVITGPFALEEWRSGIPHDRFLRRAVLLGIMTLASFAFGVWYLRRQRRLLRHLPELASDPDDR